MTIDDVKVGDKVFKFNIPSIIIPSMLSDWYRLIEQQKSNEDIWTAIPELPQYIFKNLKIEHCPFETVGETTETTITFKYDDITDKGL